MHNEMTLTLVAAIILGFAALVGALLRTYSAVRVVVLLIDVSGSTYGEIIDSFNKAALAFQSTVKSWPRRVAARVEVAMVAFNHEAFLVRDFTSGDLLDLPELESNGGSDLHEALAFASQKLAVRLNHHIVNNDPILRPMIVMATDGVVTAMSSGKTHTVSELLKRTGAQIEVVSVFEHQSELESLYGATVHQAKPADVPTLFSGYAEKAVEFSGIGTVVEMAKAA